MPSHLKRMVRERMAKTGESYQAALKAVRAAAPAPRPATDTEAAAAIRRLDPFQAAPNPPKEEG